MNLQSKMVSTIQPNGTQTPGGIIGNTPMPYAEHAANSGMIPLVDLVREGGCRINYGATNPLALAQNIANSERNPHDIETHKFNYDFGPGIGYGYFALTGAPARMLLLLAKHRAGFDFTMIEDRYEAKATDTSARASELRGMGIRIRWDPYEKNDLTHSEAGFWTLVGTLYHGANYPGSIEATGARPWKDMIPPLEAIKDRALARATMRYENQVNRISEHADKFRGHLNRQTNNDN